MVFLLQKGECNLKKPYHSVLNMSLSVLMLPYRVHLLYHGEEGVVPLQLWMTVTWLVVLTEHVMNVLMLSCNVAIFIYSIKLFELAFCVHKWLGGRKGRRGYD